MINVPKTRVQLMLYTVPESMNQADGLNPLPVLAFSKEELGWQRVRRRPFPP